MVVEYRCPIPSLIFFVSTQLSILIQLSSNIVTPSLPSSLSSLPNSPYLFSGRRISLPHPFRHLFRPYQLSILIQLLSNIVFPSRHSSFFVPTHLSILNQLLSNSVAPFLPSSFLSLPNSPYLFSSRRISFPHPVIHLFRPYPTLHTYSVVVEYRYPISSLIFFVPTQLSILIQWSSNIVAPSLPSSFSSLPSSPYLFSSRRISLPHPFPHLFSSQPNSPYLISCCRIALPHSFPHLFCPFPTLHTYSAVVEYRFPIPSFIFFVPTQLSILIQWSSNIVTPSLPSSFSSLPSSPYLFSGRRISLPHPFPHLFRPYPTLHTYSVVVEYRYPIPSLIFFVPTQLSILIQWSSNIVTPSLPSSFSFLPNSPYLFSGRRISLPHPFPHLFRSYPTLHTYSVVVEYRYPIPSLIFFVLTQLSILIQLSSNIVTPSLPSSFLSLPNSPYLFSGHRISLPHPFPHLFRPYPTLHTYSVVVEYRYPIPSVIFFVPTQLSILIQWSSNIITPSLPSSFSSLPNSPYLFSCRRISLLHPFLHFLLV